MIGQRINHYRILSKLGEGGMGVVYKAEDTKLQRTVALKFLPRSALITDEDKMRFVHEARAAASLDHPNICTIYEFDETEDHVFISMAFVEGSSLRERIDERPLKVESALDIAIQIAEGAQAAHEKDIVHRDIKSANVMISDRDRIKIMDFGLAKLVGTRQTKRERSTMGTVAYMAPEQTRGDAVDERTDIWAVGIVMYEMLTGLRPFRGDYEQSVIYAICNEEPEPITALRTGVPVEFEHIVFRALAKSPKDRYQSAEELLADLRRLKTDMDSKELLARSGRLVSNKNHVGRRIVIPTAIVGVIAATILGVYLGTGRREAAGAQIPIAVADFVNATEDPQLDGLSGMLITALEQSRWLSVLTRSSMFDFLKQMGREDVTRIDERIGREICAQAGINVLIVPTIQKFDDVYTVDIKAFELGRSEYLFAASEQASGRSSIPGLIDAVAKKARRGLNEKSATIAQTSESVASVTTPNLEAYQQYFIGEESINRLQFDDAQEAFRRAIALDSTFALAHYRLAYANWWRGESEEIQRAQLKKAQDLIDRLPERFRYLLRAQVAVSEEGYEAGIALLKEMERLYPDDKEMIYNIGDFSVHAEKYEQAERYLLRVLEMDPTFERALNHLTMTYTAMDNREKAIGMAKRYADQSKTDYAYLALSNVYLTFGDTDGALRVAEEARKVVPNSHRVQHQMAIVRCMRDDFDAARTMLDSLVVSTEDDIHTQLMAHRSLVGANLYAGRYREALAHAAKGIELSEENGDSVSAIFLHQLRGIVSVWGWDDKQRASAEFDKARQLFQVVDKRAFNRKKAAVEEYWSNVAIYHLLNDRIDVALDIAGSELRGSREHFDRVRLIALWKRGDHESARALADSMLTDGRQGDRTIILYYLAKNQLEHGRVDGAIASLEELQATRHYGGARPIFYPPSYFLLGVGYERRGDTNAAISAYEHFLDMWKGADSDLHLLQEARTRLADLKRSATQ